MPKKTFNATMKEKLDNCAFIFNKSKTAANGKSLNTNIEIIIPLFNRLQNK